MTKTLIENLRPVSRKTLASFSIFFAAFIASCSDGPSEQAPPQLPGQIRHVTIGKPKIAPTDVHSSPPPEAESITSWTDYLCLALGFGLFALGGTYLSERKQKAEKFSVLDRKNRDLWLENDELIARTRDLIEQLRQRNEELERKTRELFSEQKERQARDQRIAIILEMDPEIEKRANARAEKIAQEKARQEEEKKNRETAQARITAVLDEMKRG